MNTRKLIVAPIAAAIGTAFIGSTAIAADQDALFGAIDLDEGYMVAGGDHDKGEEGSCGEGSCGGDDGEEGSCGEGDEEGSCGEGDEEGSCGEGSCGEDDDGEGEGSCGEGSCGGTV